MKSELFDLVKDILLLLLFLGGTLLMWEIIKLPPSAKYRFDQLFKRSRTRFKWMFLLGFIALAGLIFWKRVLGNDY